MGASASALERQGIETEKGNINREIKKHNSLVKEIKNRLSEINSWLGSLIEKLQEMRMKEGDTLVQKHPLAIRKTLKTNIS